MKKILITLTVLLLILTGCGNKAEQTSTDDKKAAQTSGKESSAKVDESKLPTFTRQELKKYNGADGKIYIGYSGKVYDVTEVKGFTSGPTSAGHRILYGKDLTVVMKLSPHGAGVIKSSSSKLIGKLVD